MLCGMDLRSLAAIAGRLGREVARRRLVEEISRFFPHWKGSSAEPDLGDPQATDDLLAIIDQIDGSEAKAIPLLRAALKDREWSIRFAAASALGRIGPAAKEALPALWPLLHDEDPIVRDAAREAIKKIELEE